MYPSLSSLHKLHACTHPCMPHIHPYLPCLQSFMHAYHPYLHTFIHPSMPFIYPYHPYLHAMPPSNHRYHIDLLEPIRYYCEDRAEARDGPIRHGADPTRPGVRWGSWGNLLWPPFPSSLPFAPSLACRLQAALEPLPSRSLHHDSSPHCTSRHPVRPRVPFTAFSWCAPLSIRSRFGSQTLKIGSQGGFVQGPTIGERAG